LDQAGDSTLRKTAVTSEPQNAGYALEVDGRIKTEFQTKEGAQKGAVELKSCFPMLQIKIYDAASKTRETVEVT
jgi:hypothetical protein